MSTLRVNTLQNAAGTGQPAMSGAAKAWVNFNGTGTVAIRASFNVTSITDNGTGDYTVNFTNALQDENYSAVYGSQDTSGGAEFVSGKFNSTYSSTAIRVQCWNFQGNARDLPIVNIAVFR